jgi:hypothetical protein
MENVVRVQQHSYHHCLCSMVRVSVLFLWIGFKRYIWYLWEGKAKSDSNVYNIVVLCE